MTTKNHLCNLCGLSCKPPNPSFSENEDLGLIDCVVSGGYDSTPGNGKGALDDVTQYKFSLCEFCLDWLFVQFKIPVEVSDYPICQSAENFKYIRENWIPAKNRVENDDWRRMKKEFFAEFEKRNQARELKEYK
jgi:hypothetical protein